MSVGTVRVSVGKILLGLLRAGPGRGAVEGWLSAGPVAVTGPASPQDATLVLPGCGPTVPETPASTDVSTSDETCPVARQLVLRSDGGVVGAVLAGLAPLVVGRHPAASLVVPRGKGTVSRRALVVARRGLWDVEARVTNRNGAWLTPLPRGGEVPVARSHLLRGARVTLRAGDRIDLDRAATVTLSVDTWGAPGPTRSAPAGRLSAGDR